MEEDSKLVNPDIEGAALRDDSAGQAQGPAPGVPAKPRSTGFRLNLGTFESMAHYNFRLVWGATVGSSGGYWLQQIIVGWLAYDITGSAFVTSITLGLGSLPILFAGPFGGVLADAWDRKKLLASIAAYQCVLSIVFSVVVITDLVTAWSLILFVLLMGVSWVATEPARMAVTSQIVPRDKMINAFALTSVGFSATRLIAPAIGGALIALVGPGPTLLAEGALQAMAFGMAMMLRLEPASRPRVSVTSALSDLREAVRYVKSEQVLLGLMLFAIIPAVLVAPFSDGLMPVYAAEVFDVGPTGLGILLSALGVGSTVGNFVLASMRQVHHKGALLIGIVLITAVAMAVFSQIGTFWTAVLILLVIGAGSLVTFTVISASVQTVVRDDFRGRASGLFMVSWGFMPAGSLVAGTLAETLSAPSATLFASGAIVVAVVALVSRFRAIRDFQ